MSDEGRAILTKSEAEILSGEKEVNSNYELKVQSLVRNRVRKKFGRDVEILKENFPEVYNMMKKEFEDDLDSVED